MTTTLEDVAYDDYLKSLHDDYVRALEAFAESEDLEGLKKNLDELNKSATEVGQYGNRKLAKELKEISTLNSIYKKFLESERKGKTRFIVGTGLAVAGILLTVVGIYLTVRAQ